ncbi:MAG: metallophosphoesterase [Anaerolineae bacterium]
MLVVLNVPAGWSWWKLVIFALAGSGLAAVTWRSAGAGPWLLGVVALLGLAAVWDALVLSLQARRRVAFGPLGSQFVVLQIPRWVAAFVLGVIGRVWSPAPAFGLLAGIEGLAAVLLAWGAWVEPRKVGLTRLFVPWPALSPDDPPLRILHISDLHVERWGRREEQVLALARELHPDIILVTGDYVNLSNVDDPQAHADARRVLAGLEAPLGVYAVLGSPPVDRRSAGLFQGLRARLLRDEVCWVDAGGRRLAVIGMDCSHDTVRDGERLRRLCASLPADAYRVLLYHSPDLMPTARELGIDLYLCGHTHGGQVRLPAYGALITSSRLGKQYEMGLYREGRTHLYVSRGVGLEGLGAPRLRFLCRPEVTLVTLG